MIEYRTESKRKLVWRILFKYQSGRTTFLFYPHIIAIACQFFHVCSNRAPGGLNIYVFLNILCGNYQRLPIPTVLNVFLDLLNPAFPL